MMLAMSTFTIALIVVGVGVLILAVVLKKVRG
jgi:hypothetical protein